MWDMFFEHLDAVDKRPQLIEVVLLHRYVAHMRKRELFERAELNGSCLAHI